MTQNWCIKITILNILAQNWFEPVFRESDSMTDVSNSANAWATVTWFASQGKEQQYIMDWYETKCD